jgi:integrase
MRGRALGRGSLRLVSGVYVADWRDADGRRHRKALSSDRRVAERILAAVIRDRDLAAGGLGGEAPRSVPALAAEYLQDLRMRATPTHAAEATRILLSLPRSLQVADASQLAPAAVLAHLRARVAAGASVRTANSDAVALRACLTWAVRAGLLRVDPLAHLRLLPRDDRRRRRALSDAECAALLRAAADEDRAGGRSQAPFWRALIETGARRGELAALRWPDADLELGVLRLPAWATKGRKARDLPIGGTLLEQLRVLRSQDAGEGFVFRSRHGKGNNRRNTHRHLQRLLRAAGILRVDAEGRSVDVHALRHTCATRLARAGVDLERARRILGHADPRITAAVYTHLQVADLAIAVASVPALPT